MATNYYDDDEDNDTTTDVVGQLRKVNRTLEKRAKELEQELAGLKTQTRQRTVKDVLQAKGLNPWSPLALRQILTKMLLQRLLMLKVKRT